MVTVTRALLVCLAGAAATACRSRAEVSPAPAPDRGAPEAVEPPKLPAEGPVVPAPLGRVTRAADTVGSYTDVSVGLHVGSGPLAIGGRHELVVTDPAGTVLSRIPGGEAWRVSPAGAAVALADRAGAERVRQEMVVVRPLVPGEFSRIGGRDFRGELWLFPDRTGLTVVNRVGLESYLAGVVPLEIGPRNSDELAAVEAQAVVSRTFAVRNLGRWRDQGFDFYPTVADQVYGGVNAETQVAWSALRNTRGEIITYGRAPIDAFFYSTCGGITAEGTEVFVNAKRPYLISIRDRDAQGRAYCRNSPRFTWNESWSGEGVANLLRQYLPPETGTGGDFHRLEGIRVGQRSPSDRVVLLEVRTENGVIPVTGSAVRRVLRRPGGQLLRSAAFTLDSRLDGGVVTSVEAHGRGSGHGVGLCQWGAIGRAREGHSYRDIITAYYPSTQLERLR